jgi:hypothetical protein
VRKEILPTLQPHTSESRLRWEQGGGQDGLWAPQGSRREKKSVGGKWAARGELGMGPRWERITRPWGREISPVEFSQFVFLFDILFSFLIPHFKFNSNSTHVLNSLVSKY